MAQGFFRRAPDGGGNPCAALCHACTLTRGRPDVGNEHEAEAAQDGIEALVGERQGARVTGPSLEVAQAPTRCILGGDRQHAFREVGDGNSAFRDQRRRGETRLAPVPEATSRIRKSSCGST